MAGHHVNQIPCSIFMLCAGAPVRASTPAKQAPAANARPITKAVLPSSGGEAQLRNRNLTRNGDPYCLQVYGMKSFGGAGLTL